MLEAYKRWAPSGEGSGLRFVALMLAASVFLQVTLVPRVDVGSLEAIPNLVVAVVVAVAVMRGVVVGAVCGFAGGMLVELLSPGDTLGVIALVYVAIGAWCGRFAEAPEPITWWMYLAMAAVATGLMPLWVGIVEQLRGGGPPLGFILEQLVVPPVVFSPAVALPVWWVARRLLGEPRVVEPGMIPA